jgi:hypothetical protein
MEVNYYMDDGAIARGCRGAAEVEWRKFGACSEVGACSEFGAF